MKKYVAYYRVSTQKQGESGLGLEAQRRCVAEMVSSRAGEIIADFQDIESGKKNDRPELLKAIRQTKEKGATLIIAKLDRLARNAAFILELRDSGIDFVACDIPEANSLTIGIMAILAQQERETISARTKAALQAKKHRGDTLGKPENFSDQGRSQGCKQHESKSSSQHEQPPGRGICNSLESARIGPASDSR